MLNSNPTAPIRFLMVLSDRTVIGNCRLGALELSTNALLCRPEPKYEVQVPSHSFVQAECTYNDVVRSYSRLYIASDFTHLVANWTQVELLVVTLIHCAHLEA